MLDKLYCEKWDRHSNASTSLKYHKACWCDRIKNRSGTGTLKVAHAKLAIKEKSQPKVDSVLLNVEIVEAVNSCKHLRVEMDCQCVKLSADVSKISSTGTNISKFRKLLGSKKLGIKPRKGFARVPEPPKHIKYLEALRKNQGRRIQEQENKEYQPVPPGEDPVDHQSEQEDQEQQQANTRIEVLLGTHPPSSPNTHIFFEHLRSGTRILPRNSIKR
eukprot:augustus_masked-scaffold_129-processed-gene-0.0-mRNA-1 protein AED:1.00 eAED:1.00 QI:0/0/0/0/1/1/2/0/216